VKDPKKPYTLTAHQISNLIREKKISISALLDSLLKRIDDVDKRVKGFVSVDKKSLKERAKDLESEPKSVGKLYGIPVTIKDNICVEGEPTTCGSKILAGFRPPYNATVVERLRGEGALLLGKANMDEFAFGSSCETSCYGPTHNPWDLDRIPGGSSGGSAATVAADETICALGSDTGGSIRQPAALCGVVGFKPTYGRVSRYGLIAFASSLDQIGPLTKDVRDSALLLNVIAGFDPKDSTSAEIDVPDYTTFLSKDLKGLRIGIPKEYFVKGVDKEVNEAVWKSIKKMKNLGATYEEISLPHTKYAVATYYIVAPAEASSNLERFDGVQYGYRSPEKDKTDSTPPLLRMYNSTRRDGFGAEAKRRIILGTYSLSSGYYDAYYLKAQKVRTRIKEDFDRVFKDYDCIVTPTSPTPAFKLGERLDDPLNMYLSDIFTISANLAGIPAISIPCGFTSKGLPIGLQIIGKPFEEATLLRAAYAYEQSTEWHLMKPEIKRG